LPATVAGLIVARPTAATIAIPTATAGGGRTVVPGFAADAARIRAVVAVVSARRLGAGFGDGYRAAGTGQHQRTGDRNRRQTTSDQAIAPHHIDALRSLKQSRQQSGNDNLSILYSAAIALHRHS